MQGEYVRIKNLSEYINVIKTRYLNDCIFRGENREYRRISSSLLRHYYTACDSPSIEETYSYLLSEYYREVGYELDSMQSTNFVAFSQHHGLKTNLVDFTSSPLIALFFACERDQYDGTCGYVYAIQKENTIDASDYIDKHSINGTKFQNIFRKLVIDNNDAEKELLSLFKSHYGIAQYVNEFIQIVKQNDALIKSNRLIESKLNCNITYVNEDDDKISSAYVELIRLYLLEICGKKDMSSDKFPPLPYFIYRTPLKFDRIRNQSGLFVYQGFYDYLHKYIGLYHNTIQDIIPDFTFQIFDQKGMMEELDMLGVNKRFVYGDFDNTAKYINSQQFSK